MPGIDFIQDLAVILLVAGAVGWLCHRLGMSVVVGYLAAGMVVGPYTPPFSLVTDTGRIQTLAQMGLVFLMFAIGMRLSLRRLRRLGPALLGAVFCSATLIYYLTRLLGAAMGWSGRESLFLAAMLMGSSSAIIGKVLQELGVTHERSGQMAMAVTVLEDVVSVVMLTLLTSLMQFGGMGQAPGIGQTLGLLGAFVVLAGVAGLLIVPWLLRRLSISADEELQTIGMAAMLFGLAIVAERAGYSLALGAFLIGTIVAETPHRVQVERAFEGLRDVFTAVFFVAIGMQIDLRSLGPDLGLIAGVTVFTLLARPLACTLGLTIIGTVPREALRVGLTVTPIGEFSFIIAQLGVAAALVPAKFYPLAVGVSLLTTLAAPVFTKRSALISDWVLGWQPRWLEGWLGYYRDWLERLQLRRKHSRLWQLSKKRLIQIGVEMLLVTGVMVFSEQLRGAFKGEVGRDWLFPHGPEVIFWVALALVVLAPLFAIWRNISAMALLYAQLATAGHRRETVLRPMVEGGLKVAAGVGLFLWLSAVLPTGEATRWLLLLSVVIAAVALFVLRRKLIYWHSELEAELQDVLTAPAPRLTATAAPWAQSQGEWALQVSECLLPDMADCGGKTLRELALRTRFGCTVAGIERQGILVQMPAPETMLYPRDKVLLMGTAEQVRAAKLFLATVSVAPAEGSELAEVRVERLAVPADSREAGRTLAEVAPAKHSGVQVVGLNRAGVRTLNPRAEEALLGGDELLVLGTAGQIREFKAALSAESGDGAPETK